MWSHFRGTLSVSCEENPPTGVLKAAWLHRIVLVGKDLEGPGVKPVNLNTFIDMDIKEPVESL